jgi:3-oxoacyl-[acyl-carrier-protein] synthase-3
MIKPRDTSIIISGIGSYAPPDVLTNQDLSKIVDTSDEWIWSRTGIRERRIAKSGENCSDMGALAGRAAIENAGLGVEDIDLLIVATMTPDMLFPSTACLIQKKLGLRQIPCFDVGAACSGFLYTVHIGTQMMQSDIYDNILIIGAEKLSSFLDWRDRSTCVLFGDGAGAIVLSRGDMPGVGILGTRLAADGTESKILEMPGGGSAVPATEETVEGRQHYLKMAGREVFKIAVRVMGQSAIDILKDHGVDPNDVACVIPHQANIRIIESMSARLGLSMDKFPMNLDRYGNTSAASIPIALDEAHRNGRIKSGEYILLTAFGAGLTWGSCLIKWH